jgi:Tfp pilus assembly protein PilF
MSALLDRLEAMLAQGHDGAQLRFGLANAYARAEDYESAARHADIAVTLDPDYSAAWRLLGQIRIRLGNEDEARHAFDKGLEAATRRGDMQLVKELNVFLARLERSQRGSGDT